MSQQQHCHEQSADYPGAELYFLEVATEDADNDIGYKTKCNTVGDIICKRHKCKCEERRNRILEIVPVDILDRHHHQKTNVDKRRGSCTAWN